MELDNPYWDRKLHVCLKHCTPNIPCPQCAAERNKDMVARITPLGESVLDFGPQTTAGDLLLEMCDLLPEQIEK